MSNFIEFSRTKSKVAINSASSFELYPFGAETSLTKDKTAAYDPFDVTTRNTEKLIQKIVEMTDTLKNKKEQFSNIHTALTLLLQSIDTTQAAGIFIFTDGVLSENDYSIGTKSLQDINNYYSYLRSLISSLRLKTNRPVFLVQTSYKPLNPYYPAIERFSTRQKLPKDSLKILNDSTVFWLKDTEIYDPGKNDVNSKAFADFVARANDMIIRSEPPFGKTRDLPVAKSIFVNNIGKGDELLDNAGTPVKIDIALEGVLNILAGKTMLPNPEGSKKRKTDSLTRDIPNLVPVSDIKKIKKYIDEVNIQELQKTLDKIRKQLASEAIFAESSLNSFIDINSGGRAFSPAKPTSTDLVSQTRGIKSIEQDAILAVTDYIIDRAKQEAVFAFMENVNEKIIQPDKRIQQIFPELTETLKNPDNYYDMNLLRETLRRDMKMLPDNIYQSGLFKEREALIGMTAMIRLFKNINENQSIEAAFRQLNGDLNDLNSPNSPIIHAMKFTATVIGYLTTHDLASVYQDKAELERLSKLIVSLSLDADILDSTTSVDLNNSARIVNDIYLQYRLISRQISEFNKDIKPSADFDGYRKLRQDAAIDIMSRCSDLLICGYDILYNLNYAEQANDTTTKAQRHQKYRNALKDFKRVKDGYFMIKSKDYTQAAFLLTPIIMGAVYATDKNNIKPAASKILYIAAEVSEAESPESIKKIVAKYALPVASYRIKHTTPLNLMVGSYLGAGLARFDETDTLSALVSPILSAPIGFDLSFRFSPASRSSFSLFASVIDLGNIVSYRLLNNNNTNKDDLVRLENILSPGVYFTYSPFSKLPLTFNLGYGLNPGRASLSLNFDMPLFAIYRKK